jgi:hypothetical protein
VKPSRRRKWFVAVGIVLLALIAGLSWVGRRRVYRTVAGTEAQLDSAGLTRGVEARRVIAILDSLGAIHSELNADGTIRARIGRSFEDRLIHGDIHTQFRFDSAQRLVARSTREIFTGP